MPPFDMTTAVLADTRGYFVGDYHAIAPTAEGFLSLFVVSNPAGSPERHSVRSVSSVERGDTSTRAREQIHLNRYQPRIRQIPPPKRRR